MKLFVILPALNEEKIIGKVLDDLKAVLNRLKGFQSEIVVIDDASWDRTGKIVSQKKIKLIRHVINRGLGGALGTGLAYAKKNAADFLVTMDADGQHDPADLPRIIKPLKQQKADIVIGKRKIIDMPWDRRVMTSLGSWLTYLLFGIYSRDTQSGFRAFNKKAINKIKIITQRMEVASEFFHEIKKNQLRFTEIPIKAIYTPYSREKGQTNLNGLEILLKLVLRLFR